MNYQYAAVGQDGREQSGAINAENEDAATKELRAQGLFPTMLRETVRPKTRAPKTSPFSSFNISFSKPRIPPKRLCTLTRQLAVMLGAGMPLVGALRTLGEIGNDQATKDVINTVAEQIEGGSTFSDALATHGRSFSSLYVNMIRAGEASGALTEVLLRQAALMEKQRRLRSRIKAALTYPIAVMIIALTITSGLMIFIVPKFANIFTQMLGGRPLPSLTLFIIQISDFMMHKAHICVALGIVAFVAWRFIRKTKAGGIAIDSVAIKMPPFGNLLTMSASAQFCQTLGTLMGAGVSVLNALQIVGRTAGNAVVSNAVSVVHDAVKEGEGISQPLASTGVFPPIMVSMIRVGENTGALPEMLGRVAETYEEEVDNAVDAMTSLIEPAMIVFLAVVIGTIVIALFLPLIVLINDLGGM